MSQGEKPQTTVTPDGKAITASSLIEEAAQLSKSDGALARLSRASQAMVQAVQDKSLVSHIEGLSGEDVKAFLVGHYSANAHINNMRNLFENLGVLAALPPNNKIALMSAAFHNPSALMGKGETETRICDATGILLESQLDALGRGAYRIGDWVNRDEAAQVLTRLEIHAIKSALGEFLQALPQVQDFAARVKICHDRMQGAARGHE